MTTLKIKDIKKPISNEMDEFEGWFRAALKSNVPLVDKIMHYIIRRKGKQMRPMFVFLTAKALGETNKSSYVAASLIELLHTATLVHDDVVDDAYKRRGFFSINALWKNKIAVLVGDYLLSKGLLLAIDNDEFNLLKIVSTAVKEMSEGELLQIEKARRLDISEEIYFEIIRQKTATLIAACCASGAASVTNDKLVIQKMHQFGEYAGIAFQIKDDLFDYGSDDEKIGKPTGIDIKEKKMTLPLIYTLNNSDRATQRNIINIVKNHNTNPKKVKEVIDYVKQAGGIEYTQQKMLEYKEKALKQIEDLPESEAKQSLINLVLFTTERKK
jgi:octaprenyl-diphosphate synthase